MSKETVERLAPSAAELLTEIHRWLENDDPEIDLIGLCDEWRRDGCPGSDDATDSVCVPDASKVTRDMETLFICYGCSEKSAAMIADFLVGMLQPLRKELKRLILEKQMEEE